jgi:hypothetical protein
VANKEKLTSYQSESMPKMGISRITLMAVILMLVFVPTLGLPKFVCKQLRTYASLVCHFVTVCCILAKINVMACVVSQRARGRCCNFLNIYKKI